MKIIVGVGRVNGRLTFDEQYVFKAAKNQDNFLFMSEYYDLIVAR